jgi:NAD(P)H-flavin reductase
MLSAVGGREIPISISGDSALADRLAFTIRRTGASSSALASAQPGDFIQMRGPFGNAWPVGSCRRRDILLIAGGMGLASLRPVIYSIRRHRSRFGRLHILIGARSPSDLVYLREFNAWRKYADVLTNVNERCAGWCGRTGLVTALIESLPLDPQHTVAMTCGPEPMMRSVGQALENHDVPGDRIFLSTASALEDGPIVTYSALPPQRDWERLAG